MANSEKAASEATAPTQPGLRKKQSGSADSTPSHSRAAPPSDASKAKLASLWDKLPPWVSSNLRQWKSWKVLLRCWVVSWLCFVIMLPDKSLATLGNTCVLPSCVDVGEGVTEGTAGIARSLAYCLA